MQVPSQLAMLVERTIGSPYIRGDEQTVVLLICPILA